MTREATLPQVFDRYARQVKYVAQRGANEFSSTCPKCGGEPHDDEWPDRMRWFVNGKARGWCRRCGTIFWPDDAVNQRMNTAEMDAWRLQREAAEHRRMAEAERALDHLRQEKVWLEYVALMDDKARAWWTKRGVPAEWQTHLQLGYVPNKDYTANGQHYSAPAYSIPYFKTGFEFVALQFRLDTTATTDRYRFETGTHAAYFMAEPANPIGEQVIICEGATKAMVTNIYGDTKHTVLAVPSKSTWGGVVEAVAQAERVYVILDPDAEEQATKMARAIGPRARRITLFGKVDDLIIQHGMTSKDLAAAMRQAT